MSFCKLESFFRVNRACNYLGICKAQERLNSMGQVGQELELSVVSISKVGFVKLFNLAHLVSLSKTKKCLCKVTFEMKK